MLSESACPAPVVPAFPRSRTPASRTYRSPIVHLSFTYRSPASHLSRTAASHPYRSPIVHLSFTYRSPASHLSRTPRVAPLSFTYLSSCAFRPSASLFVSFSKQSRQFSKFCAQGNFAS